jgi:hypothetical protein
MSLAINWTEIVETVSPSSMSFGRDETRMALVGDTDFNNIVNGNAVKSILGFSARNPANPGARPPINRLVPMRCPIAPWLYATKITNCQFIQPAAGNQIALAHIVPPSGNPNVPIPASINPQDATLDPYAVYKTARLTVLFETLPYDVLSDAQMSTAGYTDEFYRWTLKLPVANIEQIIRPGNTYQFANGPTTPNILNTTFPQGLVVRAQKRDLVVKWFQVPAACLLDVGQVVPPLGEPWTFESKVFAQAIGTVNNATWHGYRRGEVLMKTPRVEPAQEPVPPQVLGLAVGAVPRCYNVEFHFQVFQPTYDPTELNNNTYQTFGHQTAPAPVGNPIYFYQIAAGGSSNVATPKAWLYPESNFNLLFGSL